MVCLLAGAYQEGARSFIYQIFIKVCYGCQLNSQSPKNNMRQAKALSRKQVSAREVYYGNS